MKLLNRKAVSVLLCTVLAFALCVPVFAAGRGEEEFEDFREKLYNFWQQEAYDGLNNGEAVYDHEWTEGVTYLNPEHPSYDGTWDTHIVSAYTIDNFHDGAWIYDFKFISDGFAWYGLEYFDDMPPIAFDGWDELTPDLYGDLDLSNTCIYRLFSPNIDQTHISSVCLDGCSWLEEAAFIGQNHCESFSALGCPSLRSLVLTGGAFRTIDFDHKDYGAFALRAAGPGYVGVVCSKYDEGVVKLSANDPLGLFIGWYKGDMLVSRELETDVTTGGTYTACFAGDADDNGELTAADALLILRYAMDVLPFEINSRFLDIDGNGSVEASDALIVMRIAMGVN